MISYTMASGTLHQYCAAVPYGSTVEACLCDDGHRLQLMSIPEVMILGRHGQLFRLNMTGALIVEAIIQGKSGREILEILIRYFAKSVEQAIEIQQDYLEITDQLEKEGYVERK